MKIKIEVGNESQDYPYGDFLNAVNELVCYFENNRDIDLLTAARHLELYAAKIEREES